jgi:predicted short-subunit dehydrogenase-like oxidoreductase (DUF2520 family)
VKLGIIGGGRAAWAFGHAWKARAFPIAGVALRDGSSSELPSLLNAPAVPVERLAADSDLLLLAIPDGAIAQVAAQIAPHVGERAFRFHASGSLPSSVLGAGPRAFSLHPLAALPPAGTVPALPPPLLVFEGPEECLAVAQSIADAFGAPMSRIHPGTKPLYHAGAVLGSNHVAALLEVADGVLQSAGVGKGDSREAIAALARSAIENWASSPPAGRFTGPVARAERATIASHLDALADRPEVREIYRRLSLEVAGAVENARPQEVEISEIIDLLRNRAIS